MEFLFGSLFIFVSLCVEFATVKRTVLLGW